MATAPAHQDTLGMLSDETWAKDKLDDDSGLIVGERNYLLLTMQPCVPRRHTYAR